MKFEFGFLLLAVVSAGLLQEKETEKACDGCPVRCGFTPPPGRRPCCPSSSDVIPPPPPNPCKPCHENSSFYCPCECPSSSSTICPPPFVPVPPCPVICCDSSCSSSSSSSCVKPCPYRRVPVPRPFLRCKSSSSSCSSSSSSSSCCPCPGRKHPKAALEEESPIVEKAQKAIVLQDGCKPLSSSSSSSSSSDCKPPHCPKDKALHTVFELDKKFVKYVNEQNLPALYKLAQTGARYAMVTPLADQPTCTRVVGPLSQFLPNYIGNVLTTVFQDIVYNEDGSVTIHVLDIITNGCQTLIVEDVWRTYTSLSGCNYKIDYLNGVNWVCK